MTTKTHDLDLTPSQLVGIVRGSEPDRGIGKMRALAAIQLGQVDDAGGLLRQILADKQEPPRFRHMAAVGLSRLGGEAARKHLADSARIADEASAVPIALGLGRVGRPEDMAAVDRLTEIAPAHARSRARFAATLLAYRFALPGREVAVPAMRKLQSSDRDQARPIVVRAVPASDAGRALKALEIEPLDARITPADAARFECRPNTFVWLWSGASGGNELAALKNPAIAGVLTVQSPVEDTYSLSLVGLVTPAREGNLITLHRPQSGEIMYAGAVDAEGRFDLRARDWPGLAAVEIGGRIVDGRIEAAVALSAVTVAKAKIPGRSMQRG